MTTKTIYNLTHYDDADWSPVAQVFLDCLLDHLGEPKKESVIESHSYGDSSEYARVNWNEIWSEGDRLIDLLNSPTGNTEATHVSGHGLRQTSVSEELYDDVWEAVGDVIIRDNSHIPGNPLTPLFEDQTVHDWCCYQVNDWIFNFTLEDTLRDALRLARDWITDQQEYVCEEKHEYLP